MATEQTCYAQYVETEETTEQWRDWLVNMQAAETEPSTLTTVTDVCASAKLKATLRDEAGFERGRVDADGKYRLT